MSNEEAERDRKAYRVADLHASGYKPRKDDLDRAPRIEGWLLHKTAPRCYSLAGYVEGHPLRGEDRRLMRTSTLIAIDIEAGWARTYNRYYVLGKKYVPPVETVPDDDGPAIKI